MPCTKHFRGVCYNHNINPVHGHTMHHSEMRNLGLTIAVQRGTWETKPLH